MGNSEGTDRYNEPRPVIANCAELWSTLEGFKLQFSSTRLPEIKLFHGLQVNSGEKEIGTFNQIRHCGTGLHKTQVMTVICSLLLHETPQTYFEIEVIQLPDYAVVVIGLQNHEPKLRQLPGWTLGSFGYHSDDGNLFQDDGEKGRPLGPTYKAGDTVGCGIDASGELFFTRNGQILKTSITVETADFFPVFGFDKPGCVVSVHMTATNPLSRCSPSSFRVGPGKIPSLPDLSLPLGGLQLQPPIPQTCMLLDLPNDILLNLLHREHIGSKILETCRLAYMVFSPICQWPALHDIYTNLIGYYADYSNEHRRPTPSTFGFQLAKSGRWRGLYLEPNRAFQLSGSWIITKEPRQEAWIKLTITNNVAPDKMPKGWCLSTILKKKAENEEEDFGHLTPPPHQHHLFD